MNSRERKTYLDTMYLNKKVKIVADLKEDGNGYLGMTGVCVSIREAHYQSTAAVRLENGNTLNFYLLELEVEKQEPIVHKEKTGIKIAKRTIENVDDFGNDYVIQLLVPDQKYIYLSSSLRTLLDINEGDFVNFAVDPDSKLYYICKESDTNNGYQVKEGKIDSNVEWRNLYNTFNLETTKIDEGKKKFHVSHYEREQEDVPDYHLFLINEGWISPEGKKKGKRDVKMEAADGSQTQYIGGNWGTTKTIYEALQKEAENQKRADWERLQRLGGVDNVYESPMPTKKVRG